MAIINAPTNRGRSDPSGGTTAASMRSLLDCQRAAFLAEGPPTADTRTERIDRLIDLLLRHADSLTEALSLDFGHRSPVQTLVTDILGILPALKHTRRAFEHGCIPLV